MADIHHLVRIIITQRPLLQSFQRRVNPGMLFGEVAPTMDASWAPAVLPIEGRTILVVENNALVRRSLVTFVGSLGFRVIAVRSAEEALQVAPSRTIHIVLTDLFLPMRNGIQLVKLLFDLGVRTPAVLLTGYISERARREADEAGIAAILEKPRQLDRLGYTLVRLCGNPSTVNHYEQ